MKYLQFIIFTLYTVFSCFGQIEWGVSIGNGEGTMASDIKIDPFGNSIVFGHYKGTVDFDPGAGEFNLSSANPNNIFIQKLSPSGDFIWAKSIEGSYSNWSEQELVIDQQGNIFFCGT